MEKMAKIIDPDDNVVTSLSDIKAGERFAVKKGDFANSYIANHDIPFGHKIAIQDIQPGEDIVKYGKPIGIAATAIAIGDWIHTHNVKDNYEVK